MTYSLIATFLEAYELRETSQTTNQEETSFFLFEVPFDCLPEGEGFLWGWLQ